MSKRSKYSNKFKMSTEPQEAITQLVPEIQFFPARVYNFTHLQLHDALLYAQEMMERCLLLDAFLVGDTAKAIMSTELPILDMQKIELGITRLHFTEVSRSLLLSVLKDKLRQYNDRFEFDYKGVPIIFHIYNDAWPFFKHLDKRIYTLTEFFVPNPFDTYYKVKDDIK